MSTSDDLLEEYSDHAAARTLKHDERLVQIGVPEWWLRDWMAPARYGVARARLDKDGTWTPDPSGAAVCVLPEPPLAHISSMAWPTTFNMDLVAFSTGDPSRWWVRTRNAALLNADAVDEAAWFERPLMVFAHPLEWMQAGGDGVVVLDWKSFLPLHLSGPPSLTCTSVALAERLDRKLRRPPSAFKINVVENRAAA